MLCMLWLCTFSPPTQVHGIPSSELSTKLMEDPEGIASFAAFLVARDVNADTLTKHVSAIRKVLTWRASRGGMTAAQHHLLTAVINWVATLQSQCQYAARPPMSNMRRAELPSAREVLRWQLQIEGAASQMLAQDVRQQGRMYRQATAVASLNAAFLGLAFGYLPPPRLACLRTCLHPDYVEDAGGCIDEACRQVLQTAEGVM